jgi:hypothetical protein
MTKFVVKYLFICDLHSKDKCWKENKFFFCLFRGTICNYCVTYNTTYYMVKFCKYVEKICKYPRRCF